MSSNYIFLCVTNSSENTNRKVPLYDSVEWLRLIGLMTSLRQQMIGQVPGWPFTDRCEWRKSPDLCCLLRLSVGIKAPVLSTACRAKHQWNLSHFTFSNKVERGRMWWWLLIERQNFITSTDHPGRRSSGGKWRLAFTVFGSAWDSSTVVAIFVPTKDSNPKWEIKIMCPSRELQMDQICVFPVVSLTSCCEVWLLEVGLQLTITFLIN